MPSRVAVLVALSILVSADRAPCQASARPTSVEEIRALISDGEPDSAIALAKTALSSDSGNVDILFALADAQAASGESGGRRATLNRIIRLHPRSVEVRIAIAEDFFNHKQLDSAAYYANAALANSNRRSADAFYWVGRTHQEAGRADSALFYYRGAWTLLHRGELF